MEQRQSENIGELAAALAAVQGALRPAVKDSSNPFFKSKYADLNSVWESARELLHKNGLAVIQTTDGTAEEVAVVTTLAHKSGQWITGRLALKPVKCDPQGVGSAITYGRRYGLAAICGICADDDDDGNAASGRHEDKPTRPTKQPAGNAGATPRTSSDDSAAPTRRPEPLDPAKDAALRETAAKVGGHIVDKDAPVVLERETRSGAWGQRDIVTLDRNCPKCNGGARFWDYSAERSADEAAGKPKPRPAYKCANSPKGSKCDGAIWPAAGSADDLPFV